METFGIYYLSKLDDGSFEAGHDAVHELNSIGATKEEALKSLILKLDHVSETSHKVIDMFHDRNKKALEVIEQYGGIDGGHHKQWVLDQAVQALVGNEEKYKKWLAEYAEGEDGPHTYQWDQGIAP